ncbi:hypothetical protein Bbelb_319520 [Branchiostoma belcheri]|nr:hypothetical protein Bbelb_319520 [Branchiostoma belcheri]
MDDLSEASMMPASLDIGSPEASFTQADEVGHFWINCSYEEGYDDHYDDNLSVVSDAADDENGQADKIDSAGNPDGLADICQDIMEVCEGGLEETKPKTALGNDNCITTTLSRSYNATENSVHTSACVGDDSNIRDIRHPPGGLYQNPSCEQDTRNPNLVYTQNAMSLNPMYMLYQQDTQDPSPMYAPNTSQDYVQSTANPNQINEPNEAASGLATNEACSSSQTCTLPHHGAVADGRNDNIPTADRSGFVQSTSAIPTSGHSASCTPPNQIRTRNALIPNPMYVSNVRRRETTRVHYPTPLCSTYWNDIIFDKTKEVTTARGTYNYRPDDLTSCSTRFDEEEKYDLNAEIGTSNHSVRDEELRSISNSLLSHYYLCLYTNAIHCCYYDAYYTIKDVLPPNINTINNVHPPNINTIKDVLPPNINTIKNVLPPNINTINNVHPPNINTINNVHPPNINTINKVIPPNINTINNVHPPNINTIDNVLPPNINTIDNVLPPKINTIDNVLPPKINTNNNALPPIVEDVFRHDWT